MGNSYNILLTKKAEKFIRKQDKDTQKRIINAISELPEGDVERLKGIDKIFRLRVGDFRILFEKNDKEVIIIVIDIGNRDQVYK